MSREFREDKIISREYGRMFTLLFIVGVIPLIIWAIILFLSPGLSNLSYFMISTILGSLYTWGESAALKMATTWCTWYIITFLEKPLEKYFFTAALLAYGIFLGLLFSFIIETNIRKARRKTLPQ